MRTGYEQIIPVKSSCIGRHVISTGLDLFKQTYFSIFAGDIGNGLEVFQVMEVKYCKGYNALEQALKNHSKLESLAESSFYS